jgi:hypothetical protein
MAFQISSTVMRQWINDEALLFSDWRLSSRLLSLIELLTEKLFTTKGGGRETVEMGCF